MSLNIIILLETGAEIKVSDEMRAQIVDLITRNKWSRKADAYKVSGGVELLPSVSVLNKKKNKALLFTRWTKEQENTMMALLPKLRKPVHSDFKHVGKAMQRSVWSIKSKYDTLMRGGKYERKDV